MKEECKLCSVGGWGGGAQTTDFSISSLMRPTVAHSRHMDPGQDAVLLSAYLLKLGDYPLYTLHNYYANLGEYRAFWAFFLSSGFDSACIPLDLVQDASAATSDEDVSLKAFRIRIPGVTIIIYRKTINAAEAHACPRAKRNPIDKKKTPSDLLKPTNKYTTIEKNYK